MPGGVNQVGGDSHQYVKNGPYDGEKNPGRTKGRLLNGGVQLHVSAEERGQQTDGNRKKDENDKSVFGFNRVIFHSNLILNSGCYVTDDMQGKRRICEVRSSAGAFCLLKSQYADATIFHIGRWERLFVLRTLQIRPVRQQKACAAFWEFAS